jgi:putative peptide zinc metalloprotease protein
VLKPWARTVVTTWVLLVVPLLLFSLSMMVLALPRVLATAWAKVHEQSTVLASAWGRGDLLEATARGLAVVAIAFPILATFVVLVRVLRRTGRSVWQRTSGRPGHRAVAVGVACALVGGLAWAWWPHPGNYRPIQPGERGTLVDGVAALPAAALARPAPPTLRVGSTGRLDTVWPTSDPLPSRNAPRLAVVLVPRRPGTTGTASASAGNGWVFPFDKPLVPGPGDNQALAVNTTDNTAAYDVAFALVWADGNQPATNTNEAFAAASCTHCAAVAVAFQVVMVIGPNHAAAPENLSVAVNYHCVNCLTYALAQQLFVTLDRPLSDASRARLQAIWRGIAAFGAHIQDVPLDQIQQRLDDFERQILAVVESDQGLPGATPSTAASSAAGSPAPTPAATTGSAPGTADPGGAASPSAGASQSPAAAPSSPEPTTSDGPSPTSSPAPTTAAASASP